MDVTKDYTYHTEEDTRAEEEDAVMVTDYGPNTHLLRGKQAKW